MDLSWPTKIKSHRQRHGLSQSQLAQMIGVSQRTISRWERGDDNPSITQQKRLRDMGWKLPSELMRNMASAVTHCPAPRALTRTAKLNLQAVSRPAVEKRPSIVNWLGRDLAPIASGILSEMLDNQDLQRAIKNHEISCVITTAQSVLRTAESESVGMFKTTINYFFHDGTLYSDAISAPVGDDEICGYTPISMDDICRELTAIDPEPIRLKPAEIVS